MSEISNEPLEVIMANEAVPSDTSLTAKRVRRLWAEIEALRNGISDVTNRVRVIHETMKRGPATVDHGLEGNLACILDHACSKNDPEPI